MDEIGLREKKAPSATLPTARASIFGSLLIAVRRRVFYCTHCVHQPLRRSKARGREYLLWLVLFRCYRCHGCNRRFWRPRLRV
jgi:hypothetical protein